MKLWKQNQIEKRQVYYKIWGSISCFVTVYMIIYAFLYVNISADRESNINKENGFQVALTFDDGPHPVYTRLLLDGLRQRKVKASFFLIGENIEGNEEIVKRMQEEGHLIGNHTYHHVELDLVSDKVAKEEIEKTNNRIYEITGIYPTYVRAPFGAWKKNMELSVSMLPVLWTIDTLDWKTKDSKQMLYIVKKNITDGFIILMHDCYSESIEAVWKIIENLKSRGYQFVTVDQLIIT